MNWEGYRFLCWGRMLKVIMVAFGLAVCLPFRGQAQEANVIRGIAEYVPVENAEAVPHGAILEFREGVYRLADSGAYSDWIVGVAALTPSVAISSVGTAGTVPIVTNGTADVLIRGDIAAGDFVTTSNEPGVGQRADEPGFTVGRALVAASGGEPTLILISIDPRFTWPPGAGVNIGALLTSPGETLAVLPTPVRYLFAIVVALVAVIAGYWIYHRISASSVTAMGRNPLARSSIIVLTGAQSFATLILVIAGFVLAYLIIVL